MSSINEELSIIRNNVKEITETIVRLRNISGDSTTVYQETVELLQTQFREVDSSLQNIQFTIEDFSKSEEREKHAIEVEKIEEDIKL